MTEQDLRDAFDRMVAAAPPPADGTADVLATARRARRRRSLLTIAGAAVAAVAVLIAGSVLLGPTSAAPTAVHPTPTTAPPTVPGISPSQTERIVELCSAGYDGGETRSGLQLYNAIKSPWGMRYLLYGPKTYISCLHATEGDWRVQGSNGPTQWLRGPISVDWSMADGLVPYDKGPGVFSAEGRVASSVARIRVRYGSAEETVRPINGTFEVSLSVPGPEIVTGRSSIEPLDAAGQPLVPEPASTSGVDRYKQLQTCWITPDGTVLPTFVPTPPGATCKPAIRWP